MLRLFFVLAVGFIFNVQPAQSAENTLSSLATKRIGQDFFVELSFSEDISENDVTLDYSNRTIEVSIPSVQAKAHKGITKISDETVDHLYTSQNNETEELKCRII